MGINILPSIDYIYNCDFHAEHHREYKLDEAIKVFEWSGFKVNIAYYDDIMTRRSLVKKGNLAHARSVGDGYYTSASIWDYGQPFNLFNWFDWVKYPLRLLLKMFPGLRDDIFSVRN